MNTKVLVTILLCLLMVGIATANGGAYDAYDTSVTLENKDSSSWAVIVDNTYATVHYNTSGAEFEYAVVAEGMIPGCYYLIYYADKPDRFSPTQWGGDNPGGLVASLCVEPDGTISKSGSTELGINMPDPHDENIDPEDDYCDEPDNYLHCCGAKLWIVPCESYNITARKVIDWTPDEFLFETDLIWYDDTDVNIRPYIDNVFTDEDCYQAGEEITITADVCDKDGIGDLEAMVVTANFSKYGVEDLVNLTMVDCDNGNCDCICREYEGTVVITKATVHECENGCGPMEIGPRVQFYDPDFSYLIVATDPAGNHNDMRGRVDVEPGPCEHLNIEVLGRSDLLVWDHLCLNFEWDPDTPWFDYELYFTALLVTSEDEYGNMNPEICCDPIVYGTGGVSVIHDEFIIPEIFMDLPGTLVVLYNDGVTETCTITAVCEGVTEVAPVEVDIEFLEPIMSADVVADEWLFCAGTCNCDPPDCTTVTAQLIDDYDEPIEIAGVPVQFSAYFNTLSVTSSPAVFGDEIVYTDNDGIATTTLCMLGAQTGALNVIAVAECRGGSTLIDIIEPPCTIQMSADPDELIEPDECGDDECSTVTGQLLDQFNEPVEVAGLEVAIYIDENFRQYAYTNNSGIIETTICTDHTFVNQGIKKIEAEGVECEYYGSVDIIVGMPELTTITLTPDETPQTMVLCEEREFTATCYDQSGDVMCCPDEAGFWKSPGMNVTWNDGTLIAVSVGDGDVVWVETIVESELITSNEIVVDVIQGDVARLEVEMIELELCSSTPITVTCFDCNNDVMECSLYEVTIDPAEVASFIEGDVVANMPGEATLTVTIGNVYNTTDVVVNDTCEGIICNDTICYDGTCWNMTCECGTCVRYMMVDDCDGTVCNGTDLYNMTCEDGECIEYMLIEANCPECGYVAPRTHRSGGGGSGGLYPAPTPTPTNNTTVNTTEPEPEAEPTPEPTEELPTQPGSITIVTDDGEEITITVDEDGNWLPGFNGIFAILGLLSIAYIVNRRRD